MGSNSRKKNQMAIKKYLLGLSLLITVFIFLTLMVIGVILNEGRENYLDKKTQDIQNDFMEMQIFDMMAETYSRDMACLAFKSKLKKLDHSVWELGDRIESYQAASEEFFKDPYYYEMKETYNENEVYYYLILKNTIERCNLSKEVILFFYKNEEECRKCDDQSFILSDINREDDDDGQQEIAIFTFDTDLNVTTVNLLSEYYSIVDYPCVVINETPYCGIRGEQFIMDRVCENSPELYICGEYENS